MRTASGALLEGGHSVVADALQSPVFGLPKIKQLAANQRAILEWLLRDGYCEDIVLACLGGAVVTLTGSKKGPTVPLTRLLNICASNVRETVLGQFLTSVQGASSMARIRQSGKEHSWQERKSMDAIAGLMLGQVRSALDAKEPPVKLGGKEVVEVVTSKGDLRKISLRRPSKGDWLVLDLARTPKGARDAAKGDWISLTMLILCAAQAEAGWFSLEDMTAGPAPGAHRRVPKVRSKGIALSQQASEHIARDVAKWLQMGFVKEPMLTEPVNGDYLTVKHRHVLGGRGPMGKRTDVESSTAWDLACSRIAGTPWEVATGTLRAVREGGSGFAADAADQFPDEGQRQLLLSSYGRNAGIGPLHFPIAMDFRGRVYLQTNQVTYQGKDLQKGLLYFAEGGSDKGALENCSPEVRSHVLPMHLANLVGKPYNKAPLHEKQELLEALLNGVEAVQPEYPIQLYTALNLIGRGRWDCIPAQIDGTCNGLQHLTALFRDETAAPFVNLARSSYADLPGDIYAEVARRVLSRLAGLPYGWARRVVATVSIDRKLCKGPVMVLPYGGTLRSIQDAILRAMVDQKPQAVIGEHNPEGRHGPERFSPWHECLVPEGPSWGRDEKEVHDGYLAFRDRELKDHPLFHLDARRLGTVVWECIEEVLPRPIAAMQAFRDIAKAAGDRSIEWSTGMSPSPLWVVQAKAKSDRSTLAFKGYHLPETVRGLSIRQGTDDIDPRAHVSGIVANFVHSQDADHLARTMQRRTEGPFGANHDCFITRPSLMAKLGRDTRGAFEEKYTGGNHPLEQPMKFVDIKTGKEEAWPSWFACANNYGVRFPDFGKWEPREVSQSAWFFS